MACFDLRFVILKAYILYFPFFLFITKWKNAVRKVYQEFKKDQQENEENQQVFDLSAR